MPVLKSETSRPLMKNAIVLDMGDLDREAKRILERAREEAARIVAAGEQEAKTLTLAAADIGRAQGMEEGMKEGRERGLEEGRREVIEGLQPQLDKMLSQWSSALDQWEKDRAEMLLAARNDVLALALEMGRKVALRAIQADETVVVDQVAESLAYLTRPTAVTIAIHPDDRSLLEGALPALLSKFSQCTHATLRDEPSMMRGGCALSTGRGEIDATIEAQLDRIVEAMMPPSASAEAVDA